MLRGSTRGERLPGPLCAAHGAMAGLALLLACACAGTERPRAIQPEYDLHDPDPTVRMQAVEAVARSGDRRMVPQVIEMLDDRDEAVRMVAIGALRAMTDFDSDYKAFAPQAERRAQVQQWRDWHAGSLPGVPAIAGPETQ